MILQKYMNLFFRYFPAGASGFLITLAFPKSNLWIIAFFALVPWLVSTESINRRQFFVSGLVAGLCHYSTLIYWIVPTLTVYGGLNIVLAAATLVLLCLYLSLYLGLFSWGLSFLNPGYALTPLAASCLWIGLEYIRTYAFTGFPWGLLGYSQSANLYFIQIADITGVYGVSFLVLLVNFLIAAFLISIKKKKPKKLIFPVCYTCVFIVFTYAYGYYKIESLGTKLSTADTPIVSLIQGNIRQDLKWDAAFKSKTIEKYIQLSKSCEVFKPELVIWPETALPFYYGQSHTLSSTVDQCVRDMETNFLFGSPAYLSTGNNIEIYNRVFMLNRFSIISGTYDKTHLVPFGEYVPFGECLTFLGKLTAQAGNFDAGEKTFVPLPFNNHKTGVLICFEILFPCISSSFVKNGADILTTITNDAWFGYTAAAEQHFIISVFRAVENRRSIARAANTGISGFIDPVGNILETRPLFKDLTLTVNIPAFTHLSIYTRYGDIFTFAAMVAICLVFVIEGAKNNFWRKV